jgi:excisionase family DNA binding protein
LTTLKTKRRSKRKRARKANPFAVGGFKLKDAAAYLNVSEPTTRRLVERGLLRANRALRHLLFTKEELDRFLKENMV